MAGNTAVVMPSYLQAFRPTSAMNANRFDEGYSEDTRSQSGSDMIMTTDSRLSEDSVEQKLSPLPDEILRLSMSERSDLAYDILRSLPTSSIAAIVEKLNPLLHIDPVEKLPPELTFQIFSYLDPETLLRASTLSRKWRTRVMDSPLWKLLFRLEGWNSNFPRVRAYEDTERQRRAEMKEKGRKTRPRAAEDTENEKPSTKKRVRGRPLFGDGASSDNGIHDRLEPLSLDSAKEAHAPWGEQHSIVEADDSPAATGEDRMEGISYNSTSPLASPTADGSRRRKRTSDTDESMSMSTSSSSMSPPVRPSLFLSSPEPKINWQYLYKQKRRLEENWDAGRFSNFQLPHPNHPQEAHGECVYTIQYSGKYLVSGSRDRSVRVWDLDTQRLVIPPLLGHRASVLCLQFDERPGQDIIVSGGSDCSIIMWQFSTGRMLKQLEQAHSESVLNLRFDDTYLVTCSKDKTIKVWNRKEMLPTDDTYPLSTTKSGARFPEYIINMQQEVESQHLHFKPLEPYSLMMTLEGHGAAVNAIQVLDGQIVSASGDRSVKVWDVRTGACVRTFSGHSKGIACVQFDGRRIVSGSSDETVRIFDRATGAEVACLQGHSNLVRTVQAQFGDLPGNEEELEAEARAVDNSFFEAQKKGLVSREMTREQRRARNAGSKDPTAIFAYGAKLPPGGGGSRWARIVSGSYDETVVIWKKGADGAWKKSKILYQNEAVRAAGGRPHHPVPRPRGHGNHANQNQNPNHNHNQQQQQNGGATNFQLLAQQAQAQAHAAQVLQQQAQAMHVASQIAHGNTTNNGPTAPAAHTAVPVNGNQTVGTAQPHAQGAAPNNVPTHHHHAAHHHHHAPFQGPQQGTSRVFKLQFDARRIVCCSQDPTIVGWDFANNDKDIMLASQFFGDSV
ncbi:WD40 repeat-like protein [Lentithecium fluviatile CBS 122367]|uniref:WD40 repeat-like protein n=1 Tax=Lentithecium fluviatile CBS 122367 TaxID=1168545 RepID=A0A6G1JI94_9PLEO|nr:WD40 repeat-like protein [Lentithecium fluviatile CBS 122367]